MQVGTINKYGWNDGKRGLEATYLLDYNKTLRIRIEGSNHWTDYLGDFMAWPRVQPWKNSPIKLHHFWHRMALIFWRHLISEITDNEITEIRLMGHSMGGAIAAILLMYLPSKNVQRQAYLINAPKIGNADAVRWLWDDVMALNSTIVASYDKGDIVRKLPFFYCRYPWNRPYAKTRPFWKAHVNLPDEWKTFFGGYK